MRSLTWANKLAREESGGAIVEATIVTPVFLLLFFGIVDAGFFFWQWNAAGKAVQLGARLAVTSDPVATSILSVPTDWLPDLLGQPCSIEENECPDFSDVSCRGGEDDDTCDYDKLTVLADRMRDVYPQLEDGDVEIQYTANGLGFVGWPGPAVPNDVTVSIEDRTYSTFGLLQLVLPIRASATLPSEDLRTN